ncbi:HNH endonuclease [Streptomyces cavourensis]|uniref:HNH endonuclease n=1 Tax=Streptomyces cavourensis TaxID=67258 RepID=UPI001150E252|nr:HNH endonuclease [Streptomyces cavourensis]TQO32875.1 HNH endonuclease [Streptomyces cavourensis]WAE68574.1 HNH endonuclease [Streptomyces cavourensis]GGU55831.1 hypothetical protein GCM10010498_11170 [Streptomyces cavourensis]
MSHRHLNAPRRRQRKRQLAARDGARCAYCRRSFASLREATLDHVVPVSLLRTWSAGALVLACRPCNQTKADRLPLSMALLIVWAYGSDVRDESRHAPRHTDSMGAPFTADRSVFMADSSVFMAGRSAFSGADRSTLPGSAGFGPGEVDWLLLARLVHARVVGERSTPDQTKHHVPHRRAVRVGRLAHPRRTARPNTCEPATDRGVGA